MGDANGAGRSPAGSPSPRRRGGGRSWSSIRTGPLEPFDGKAAISD